MFENTDLHLRGPDLIQSRNDGQLDLRLVEFTLLTFVLVALEAFQVGLEGLLELVLGDFGVAVLHAAHQHLHGVWCGLFVFGLLLPEAFLVALLEVLKLLLLGLLEQTVMFHQLEEFQVKDVRLLHPFKPVARHHSIQHVSFKTRHEQ